MGQLDDPPPECKGYAAGEFYLSNDPTTFPLLLEDTEFTYDNVDNPIELRDWRLPHEWPAGAKPVSKKVEYDDLYRLKRLDYVYAAGKDGWTSPFAHEDAKATQGGEVGIGEKPPVDALPRQSFDERLLWQTYRYDWLGNSVSSDDDAHGFYDRSLGAIKNGTAAAGPYQLKEASNETPSKKPREGRLSAKYDEAGYLIDLAVNRSASGLCLPANKPCNHRFRYDWDEVGRLAMARRWDASTTVTANDALPTEAAAVTLRHTYDGGDMRTVKEATSCASGALSGLCAPVTTHSVYVFDSLDLRRAYFSGLSGEEPDYEATSQTEAAYLVANGVRLARLHHAPTLPVVDGDGLHVFLELADHLGSGSIVLDKATGELAERMTYQGYGAVESDYRPGRWGAFREDYRFTGKEEDSEVGLTYFGMRYLNTALGRWASADPLTVHGAGADLNAYAYVHGRVLVATDPVGLDDSSIAKINQALFDQTKGKYGKPFEKSEPAVTKPTENGNDGFGGASQGKSSQIFVGGNAGSRGHSQTFTNQTSTGDASDLRVMGGLFVGVVSTFNPALAASRIFLLSVEFVSIWAESVSPGGESINYYQELANSNFQIAGTISKNEKIGSHELAPELDVSQGGESTWGKSIHDRGLEIEDAVIQATNSEALPKNFPTIDGRPRSGESHPEYEQEIRSIKSIDLNAKTYQDPKKLEQTFLKYGASLKDFTQATREGVTVKANANTSRVLDISIPADTGTKEQNAAISKSVSSLKRMGIKVELRDCNKIK